jgi:N-methylhydantoinase B/oxoprolinase/acetone carboxylase alpha subunit
MQGGDRLLVMTPGGGGFGDPNEGADEDMEDAGALPAAC